MTRKSATLLPLLCAVGLSARQAQTPQTPVFRGATDLVIVDVSVLDANRQPVHGLKSSDFTVLEDGQPQAIETFAAIDVPDPVTPPGSAAWTKTVPDDVATNGVTNGRLMAMVLDDATLPPDPAMVAAAKRIARGVIDRLGPTDQLAVLFTMDTRDAQSFTNNRALLLAAVDKLNASFAFAAVPPAITVAKQNRDVVSAKATDPGAANPVTKPPDPELRNYVSSVDALSEVAEYLGAARDRRKAMVYVGIGVPFDPTAEGPMLNGVGADVGAREQMVDLGNRLRDVIRNAQRANVAIYGLSPAGTALEAWIADWLTREGMNIYDTDKDGNVTASLTLDTATRTAHDEMTRDRDFLELTAANTGGRATVDTNDFDPAIAQIFRETGSYYLLGYRQKTAKAPGHMSVLDVKVKQAGLDVRARNRNVQVETDEARAARTGQTVPSATAKAISGFLPDPGAALSAIAVPFAASKGTGADVALVLTTRESAPHGPSEESVEVLTSMFTPEGASLGSQHQDALLVLHGARTAGDQIAYEVLTHIALKPGRYQLRLASHNLDRGDTGSVFVDVDVPDFATLPVSLSGLVLHEAPPLPSAPDGELAALTPVVPTTNREFGGAFRVTSFMRIYQGGKIPPAPVQLATRIEDSRGTTIVDTTETIASTRFDAHRGADVEFELPLVRFTPGPYLLTMTATLGETTASRAVRFAMK